MKQSGRLKLFIWVTVEITSLIADGGGEDDFARYQHTRLLMTDENESVALQCSLTLFLASSK